MAKREDNDTDRADDLETAEDMEELEENESMVAKLEMRLHALRHAMELVKKGSYGICEVCKKPIEAGRLQANIAATTCVAHMK